MLLLEAVVIGGGLVEDAPQFGDAAVGVVGPLVLGLGPLVLGLGLLPQRVVAGQQVVEEPPAFDRIIGEPPRDAHNMNYTRSFMLCKCISDDFPSFLAGADLAGRNRLRCRALLRSMPERINASCAGLNSMPS